MQNEKLVLPGVAALVLLGLSFVISGPVGLVLRLAGFGLAGYYFYTRHKLRKAQAEAQMQRKVKKNKRR